MKINPRIPLLTLLLALCLGIAWKAVGDLTVYHSVGQWVVRGDVARIYPENAKFGYFFYGPLSLVVLKPLGYLSFTAVKGLWIVLQTAAFFCFWNYLLKIFPVLKQKGSAWLFLIVWASSIKPIHAAFQTNNVQFMFAALFVAAEYWSHSNKNRVQFLTGLLVASLAAIKIFPVFIMIYYYLLRPKSLRLGLLLGTALSFLIPILVFGLDLGRTLPNLFFSNLLQFNSVWSLATETIWLSLPSLLARWMPEAWIQFGLISIVVGVLWSAFFIHTYLTRRVNLSTAHSHSHWALMLALMALLNSSSRPDYFIYFVPGFSALVSMMTQLKLPKIYWAGILSALALISFISEWTLGSRDLSHELERLRIPVLGIILLCIILSRALRIYFPNKTATI